MKPIKIALISLIFIFILFISAINNKDVSLTNLNNSDVYYENLNTIEIKHDFKSYKEKKKEKKPVLTYYSDKIKIKVSNEIKNKINNQLAELQDEAIMLAKLIYREARGVNSTAHKAAVVWCVLNRFDTGEYGESIKVVITSKHQFAWNPNTKVEDEFLELSNDVLIRWLLEKEGFSNVGRVLPNDYLFFAGRNGLNYFRKNYHSRTYWDWSLQSPYKNDNFVGGINGSRLTNGICPRTYSKSTTPR